MLFAIKYFKLNISWFLNRHYHEERNENIIFINIERKKSKNQFMDRQRHRNRYINR